MRCHFRFVLLSFAAVCCLQIYAGDETAKLPKIDAATPFGQTAEAAKDVPPPADRIGSLFTRARDRAFHGLDSDQERTWRGPFFFMQLADTQYGFISQNTGVAEEASLAAKTGDYINRLKPRFVVVCGDLTHASPGHEQYDR